MYEYTTHETFREIDENGRAVPNIMGEYEMVEMDDRVCYGDQEPKRRRGGATMGFVIVLYWIILVHFLRYSIE